MLEVPSIQTFLNIFFRDYFFENFDEFFSSSNNGRISILDDLLKMSLENPNDSIQKPIWNIISYIFEENNKVKFFKGSEILIIELPLPNKQGEPYFIGLGVAHPPNEYSTIIPFYMLLEYVDESTAYYSEYKQDESDNFEYFYINKPVEPNVQSFKVAIVNRINKYSIELKISKENDGKCTDEYFNIYQFKDRVSELEGYVGKQWN